MNDATPLAKRVIGYADELSVRQGQTISFAVSGEGAGDYEIEVRRLFGGGFDPDAPALQSENIVKLGRHELKHQGVYPGSWAMAELPAEATVVDGFTLALTVQPWMLGRAQTLLYLDADVPFELGLTDDGRPRAELADSLVVAEAALAIGHWYTLVVSFDGAALSLATLGTSIEEQDASGWSTTRTELVGERVPGSARRLWLGAAPGNGETGTAGGAGAGSPRRDCFAGRLERPALFGTALEPAEAARACGRPGDAIPSEALVAWELSEAIGTWSVPGHGQWAVGLTLGNAPKRACCGSTWTTATSWRESPEQYGAIHFYPDGLEDCEWQFQTSWQVPPGTPSGFYAAHIAAGAAGADEDWIPFFVRPDLGAATAEVLLVASSATYFAYANSRFWWEDPIQEIAQDRLVELGPEEQYLVHHPELGLSNYDLHADGTPVVFSSRRRPNLFMRPGHSRGESYASDLYLVAWLQRLGVAFDVVTDEDLHFDGEKLLSDYRVVLSGTHPEYLSVPMYDSTRAWVEAGGRYLYVGGNGFTSCVTWGSERPWLMENRATGRMRLDNERMHAESVNQTDGELGARMDESGRSPGSLWGVDSVTMGFDRSYPVLRTQGSYAPEFEFAFAGMPNRLFGGRSLSGGGVMGQEWDNARMVAGTPGHHVLASSIDHSLIPDVLGADPVHHGDVVFAFHGAGLVFSASAMAWAGALHIDDYDNDAELFMRNILTRFLQAEPISQPTAVVS